VDHRDAFKRVGVAVKWLVAWTTPHEHGTHADGNRAGDILAQTVADHYGVLRLDADQLQRGVEDARVRLQVAVLGRRDGGADEASRSKWL
jgi:hypothetical protein